MKVENAIQPRPEQAMAMMGRSADRPIRMLNLLRFKDKAEYADGRDSGLSGAEAYAIYGDAVRHLVEKTGGHVVFSGQVRGLLIGEIDDLWDMVAIAQYPSFTAMVGMTTSPEYEAIAVHREAGLAGQMLIECSADGVGL